MRAARYTIAVFLCTLLSGGVALASWYDDYDAGISAIRKGQWQVAVQKMTAAINANGKEGDRTRTYSTIFINYHPYYYRGVAYLNLGRYEQAISDFEKTSGPGEENMGSLSELMSRAKSKLAESNTPPPVTETRATVVNPPPPVVTTQAPPPPVGPSIDNALRGRARAALDQAKARLQAAQQRNATTSRAYQDAQAQYMQANTRLASPRSNDDLNEIIAEADNIGLLADSALPPAIATSTTSTASVTRPGVVTDVVLGDTSARLRRALQDYFNGEFEDAARGFQSLSRDLPRNGWIWAFLGASQYSQYAFEGEDQYRAAAIEAFRKAKTYGRRYR